MPSLEQKSHPARKKTTKKKQAATCAEKEINIPNVPLIPSANVTCGNNCIYLPSQRSSTVCTLVKSHKAVVGPLIFIFFNLIDQANTSTLITINESLISVHKKLKLAHKQASDSCVNRLIPPLHFFFFCSVIRVRLLNVCPIFFP